jgi:hypothetical protein
MNMKSYRSTLLSLLSVAALVSPTSIVVAQSDEEIVEAARSLLKTDRRAAIETAMQFTETEAKAFWPLYDQYRAETEKIGDKIKQQILDYAGLYPDVPAETAKKALKDTLNFEKQQMTLRATHLGKVAKVLSPAKTLRYAQVDMRVDLASRLKLAANIPLVPTEGKIAMTSSADIYSPGATPGSLVVKTNELRATVIAIDHATRSVTLLGEGGIKETVKAGPDVVNFDQVKVGDKLLVLVTESLLVQMGDRAAAAGERPDEVVKLAPEGAKPGAVVANATEATGTIVSLDTSARTATLKFEDGTTKTFPVRPGVDMSKHKAGEKVVFRTTESVALSIRTP